MKKFNKYIIGLLILSVLPPSCKKDFIATNTNPAKLDNTLPEYLFGGATIDVDEVTRAQLINRYNFMAYMQYIVPDGIAANLTSRYANPGLATGPDAGVTYYNDYYAGPAGAQPGIGTMMHRIEALIDNLPADQKATYVNIRAISVILDTWHAWRTVDMFGAMPYAQAFNGTDYPLPVYDYDFELYKTFDNQLKKAAADLQSAAPNQVSLGNEDFFYAGNTTSWLAFANTLRIKIAQRYEKRDAANLAAVLTDIQTNFNSTLIASNTQSFGVNHTQTWNNVVDDIQVIETGYDAGYAFVEFLKSTNDPRLALMVRQNDFGPNSAAYSSVLTGSDATGKALAASLATQSRYWGKHAFAQSQDPTYGYLGLGRNIAFNFGATTKQLDYLSLIQGRYFVKNGGFKANTDVLFHTDETFITVSNIPMRTLWLTYGENLLYDGRNS